MMKPAILLALPLVGLAVAACSSDGEQVADQVRDHAAKELSISKDDVKTTCPDDADAKKGAKFTCDLVIDGEKLGADIEFSTSKKFSFEFTSEVFEKDALETEVGRQVAAGLGVESAQVDCGGGKKFVAISKKGTIDCSGTAADGSKGTAKVGLDDSGNPVVQDLVPAS